MKALAVVAGTVLAALLLWFPWHRQGLWGPYFLLHQRSLESLAQAIVEDGRFRSISVGQVGEYRNKETGALARYDSYRFIDDDVVTEFPHQVRPGATQPVAFLDTYCAQHGMSRARYDEFRERLEALGLGGFHRYDDGVVSFWMRRPGLTFGDSSTAELYYLPQGTMPDSVAIHPMEGEWRGRTWFVTAFVP